MIDRDSLGEAALQLSGTGLARNDSTSVECTFVLSQFPDGRILLFLESLERGAAPFLFFDLVDGRLAFEGQSAEGYQVHIAAEEALALGTDGGHLIAVCGRVAVALPDPPSVSHYEFSIVNYPVSGIRIDERVKWVDWLDLTPWVEGIPIDTPQGRVLLLANAHHRTNAERLRYTKGVGNTCSLVVKGRPDCGWETAAVVADRICRLLALLTGTRVNWVSATHHGSGGQRIGLSLQHAVVSEYVLPSPELTANIALSELDFFFRSSLAQWEQAEKEWDIATLIDAFVDARSTGLFLETKGLRLCVCLEMIVDAYLRHQPRGGHLLPQEAYERMESQLTEGIESLLRQLFPDASADERRLMASHWRGLNRVPFGQALKGLRTELGLRRKEFDAYRVKCIRDSLVHTGHYLRPPTEALGQFQLLEKSVRALLLAVLGYKDVYQRTDTGNRP